jgi:hypothetical protein
MKFVVFLWLVLASCPVAWGSSGEPRCETGLKPLVTRKPARGPLDKNVMDSFREGKVVISFRVLVDGSVDGPVIKSSHWIRRGRASDGPEGYDLVLLKTMQGWRYPERSSPCAHEVKLSFKISDQ